MKTQSAIVEHSSVSNHVPTDNVNFDEIVDELHDINESKFAKLRAARARA